jgi:hypothetical protein
MSVRMRRPETVRLEISQGDWLLVKKHLTAGEQRAIFRRMMRDGITGDRIDSVRVGWSKMIGYLLDWSIQDADGKPVAIAGKSDEEIGAALDALDVDSFKEILHAIEEHEADTNKAMEAEKQDPLPAVASSAT